MLWFVREIFPTIIEQIPDVHLIITGDHSNLPMPPSRNITLAGYVDDIKTCVASCAISIAPLLSGGGTRLKVLEAMALGTPVVATSKGAEGLNAVNNEHLLLADTPVEFAKSIIKLLDDNNLRLQIAENARRFVAEKYSWDKILSEYLNLIETI